MSHWCCGRGYVLIESTVLSLDGFGQSGFNCTNTKHFSKGPLIDKTFVVKEIRTKIQILRS